MPRSHAPSSEDDSRDDTDALGERADVDADALVRVGFVYRPHGVRGEVKVNPEFTDDPTQFETFDVLYVGTRPDDARAFAVASVRYQETKRGVTVILRLDAVNSREAAERITKADVFVPEDALDLDDDEVFIHDLIGMDVVTEEGETIGTVGNLLELPGHDVLVVTRPRASEALIPAVEDFVVDVDIDAGRIVVRVIDGLLE